MFSRLVTTNQIAQHKNLLSLVKKHLEYDYLKPIVKHNLKAFKTLKSFLKDFTLPPILDSGCGTGESCYWLSQKYPQNPIVGVDKSQYRLSKPKFNSDQILFLRADLEDFWRLCLKHNIYF